MCVGEAADRGHLGEAPQAGVTVEFRNRSGHAVLEEPSDFLVAILDSFSEKVVVRQNLDRQSRPQLNEL